MISSTTFDTSRVMVDFNQMKAFGQNPLILESGNGIRVTDVFGKTDIDGLSGVFTVNLGHGITEIVDVAAEQLRALAARQLVIAEVRGIGLMRGLAFCRPIGKAVSDACRENGLLLRPGGNWVGIAPPLSTTSEEAVEIVGIIERSLAQVVG